MLDFGWSQIMLIAAVALIFLGPKELPKVIKTVTEWAGKARALAREFRSSVDDMLRETEIKNLKEEFESAARKAETEFQQTIQKETNAFDPISPPATDAGAFTSAYTPPEWPERGTATLRPLMDHQRKKKAKKSAPKTAYKARLVGAPERRTGAASVRRRARP
jgi:sec-independent protein translocase protein TatB